MSSGFQQSIDQLQPGFYRVVLTLSGGAVTYPTADGNNNGAVNPYNWDTFTTRPTSAITAKQLARGNLRWQAIIEETTKYADAQILDVEVTSANNTNANSQPTAITFTVKYERDAGLLDSYQKSLIADSVANTTFVGYGGGTNYVDTTAKAIREMVTKAIVRGSTTGYSRTYRVYDTVNIGDSQVTITIVQPGVPASVWTDVAVTGPLNGTTL